MRQAITGDHETSSATRSSDLAKNAFKSGDRTVSQTSTNQIGLQRGQLLQVIRTSFSHTTGDLGQVMPLFRVETT